MDRNRITGAARKMGGRLREIAGTTGDDALRQAEGAYDEAVSTGGRVLGHAREHARYLADDAYDTGQRLYGQGMAQLSRQASAHPLALVVAAGLAGAALAWVVFGNGRRR